MRGCQGRLIHCCATDLFGFEGSSHSLPQKQQQLDPNCDAGKEPFGCTGTSKALHYWQRFKPENRLPQTPAWFKTSYSPMKMAPWMWTCIWWKPSEYHDTSPRYLMIFPLCCYWTSEIWVQSHVGLSSLLWSDVKSQAMPPNSPKSSKSFSMILVLKHIAYWEIPLNHAIIIF